MIKPVVIKFVMCRNCRKKQRLLNILKCLEKKPDYPSRLARRLNRFRTNLYDDLRLLLECGFIGKDFNLKGAHIVYYFLTDSGRKWLSEERLNE